MSFFRRSKPAAVEVPPASPPGADAPANPVVITGQWPRAKGGYVWQSRRPETASAADAGPWLMPTEGAGAATETYEPLRSRALLPEFLRLSARVQAADVLQFANRWGSVLSSGADGGSLQAWQREVLRFRALYDEWEAVASVTRSASADVIRRMRRLMVLRERYVWAPDGRSIRYHVRLSPDGTATPAGAPAAFETAAELSAASLEPGVFAGFKPDDALEPARQHVVRQVNQRVAGHTTLLVDPQRSPQPKMVADSLLSAIYLMFALEMGQRSQAQGRCGNPRCPNGGQFFKTRRDQRFCDKRCRELASYYRRTAAGTNKRRKPLPAETVERR